MILIQGTYYLDSGTFYITQFEVKELSNCYESDMYHFPKSCEETVQFGYGKFGVFTTDSENPVEKLQKLISNEFQKRSNLVFENTRINKDVIPIKFTEESLDIEPDL